MYRDSTPPPPASHDYAIEDAVDAISARVVRWTRWIDGCGVAVGMAVGFGALWALRNDASWNVQKLVYVVVGLGTIVVARAARVAITRALLARWISMRARASRLSAGELEHRVRMALTVQPR